MNLSVTNNWSASDDIFKSKGKLYYSDEPFFLLNKLENRQIFKFGDSVKKKANAWLIFQQRAGNKSSAGASSVMHLPLGLRTLSAGTDYFSRCLTKKSDRVNYRLPSEKDYFTHGFRKTKIKVTATANRHKDAIGFTLASYWLRGSDGVSFWTYPKAK